MRVAQHNLVHSFILRNERDFHHVLIRFNILKGENLFKVLDRVHNSLILSSFIFEYELRVVISSVESKLNVIHRGLKHNWDYRFRRIYLHDSDEIFSRLDFYDLRETYLHI